jgi:DNA-binding protein HU-beta/integration host factor subunit beta
MNAKRTTKHDIVAKVARKTGLTQSEIKIAVDEFLLLCAEERERGRVIEMRGFGTFYTKERKARPARNPKTGEAVQLGKRVVPLFKFCSALRKRVEGLKAAG